MRVGSWRTASTSMGWTTGWDSHYGRPYFIRPDLTTTWEDPRQFHNPMVNTPKVNSQPIPLHQCGLIRRENYHRIDHFLLGRPKRPRKAHIIQHNIAEHQLTPREQKPSLPPPATQKTSKKNIYSFSSSTLNLGNPEFPKSRRYCCNCFRSRSGCRRFWIIFTILLLGGLAAAGFFCGPDTTRSPETPFVMQMNVVVEVKVWSENYWDILMEKLTFEGNLLDGSGNSLESTRASGIANAPRLKRWKTRSFNWYVTSPTPVAAILNADPATALLATSCGILDRSKRSNLQISYKARVFITPISWFGLVPEQDGRVSFPCPIPRTHLI
ncbi:hypothetical protein BC829DRAFT_388618, partial [Chytridium lagenaria]